MGDFSIVVAGRERTWLEKRRNGIPGRRCEYREVELTVKVKLAILELDSQARMIFSQPGCHRFSNETSCEII